ncbi:MAG: hypothetical protein H5U40_01130, partial [Polyangiaceae bacterium]|nr:hypothetical protein [Polyangiaceae bacterium]
MNHAVLIRLCALCLGALTASACLEPSPAVDYGDPTRLSVATTQGGITLQVFSPRASGVLSEPSARVELSAFTDPPAPLEVVVTTAEGYAFAATPSGEPGPKQRFTADVPLLHGPNILSIRIAEIRGLRTRRIEVLSSYEGDAPALRFGLYDDRDGTPCGTGLEPNVTGADLVCVRGRTSNAGSPIALATARVEGASPVTLAVDASGSFEGFLPLASDTSQTVVVSIVDEATRRRTLSRSVIQDSTPPSLAAPIAAQSPLRTEALRIVVAGTVSDANGVRTLRLENAAGGVVELEPNATFQREVQLLAGENPFELIAVDVAGNETRLAFVVIRDRLIRLRPAGSAGQALLNLDRGALEELLTVQDQIETDVVAISLKTPVLSSLYAIREPERFGVDTSSWGQPEWNLHDLLNMTPDTADLSGSSLQSLLDIAPAVGLPSPRLLAELLALEPTDTFV